MGSLTEYFEFLNTPPKQLKEVQQTFTHITVTEKLKEKRREFRKEEKDNRQNTLW